MPASRGALSKLYLNKLKLQLVLFMYLQYGMLNVHYIILPWLLPYFYVKQKNSIFAKKTLNDKKVTCPQASQHSKFSCFFFLNSQIKLENPPIYYCYSAVSKCSKMKCLQVQIDHQEQQKLK